MDIVVIGAALLAFLVVMGIFYVVARLLGGPDSSIENRLDQFVSRETEERPPEDSAERTPSALTKSLDEAVAGRSFAQNIRTQLARADLKITPGEYIILTITSILGTGLITYVIMHGNPILALGGLVLGFFLPRFYVKFRQDKRLKDFNNQLGDAINLLANGLRSGYSLLQAMDAVASEMPPLYRLALSEGEHRVLIVDPDGRSRETTIHVWKGLPTRWSVSFDGRLRSRPMNPEPE